LAEQASIYLFSSMPAFAEIAPRPVISDTVAHAKGQPPPSKSAQPSAGVTWLDVELSSEGFDSSGGRGLSSLRKDYSSAGRARVRRRHISEVSSSLVPSSSSSSSVPPAAKRQRKAGSFRAVLFDFDATLTTLDGLQVDRLFPGSSHGVGTGRVSGSIDVTWLRQHAFGGEARIARLGKMLQGLTALGAELHVVSYADRQIIVRGLAILGAIHFFCDRIAGYEEVGWPLVTKGTYIRRLMDRMGWRPNEVLFVDDQEANVQDASGICRTYLTRGCGLSLHEMDDLLRLASSTEDSDCSDQSQSER
jgi:beta-phosphoglucomutase-like phosphatase (HAD superfamily)